MASQRLGSIDLAISHARRLLEKSPDLAAEQACEILHIHPGHPTARLILGAAHRRAGRLQSALDVLEALAAEFPHSAPVHLELGVALLRAWPRRRGRGGAAPRGATQSRFSRRLAASLPTVSMREAMAPAPTRRVHDTSKRRPTTRGCGRPRRRWLKTTYRPPMRCSARIWTLIRRMSRHCACGPRWRGGCAATRTRKSSWSGVLRSHRASMQHGTTLPWC